MNAKQLFLGWVRTNYPSVYAKALTQTFGYAGRPGLGGLGDDLTDSITAPDDDITLQDVSFDPNSVGAPTDVNSAVSSAASTVQSSGSSWSDFFNSLATNISSVGNAVLTTQAQANLLQINTQRAQQGLPPLTSYGVPVTAASLAPASAAVASLESSLTSGSGGMLLILGFAVLIMLAMGHHGGSSGSGVTQP